MLRVPTPRIPGLSWKAGVQSVSLVLCLLGAPDKLAAQTLLCTIETIAPTGGRPLPQSFQGHSYVLRLPSASRPAMIEDDLIKHSLGGAIVAQQESRPRGRTWFGWETPRFYPIESNRFYVSKFGLTFDPRKMTFKLEINVQTFGYYFAFGRCEAAK